jgi:hypothetical protein
VRATLQNLENAVFAMDVPGIGAGGDQILAGDPDTVLSALTSVSSALERRARSHSAALIPATGVADRHAE